ncbi:MAG: HAD family hydrolase [Pseudomonadota bacterium]|jgi:HAD superfamily hydrolase (TIGR01509 family)
MKPLQACIFDMDGVLLDSERFQRDLVISASQELGYDIPNDVYLACVGRNERDTRQIFEERISSTFPHQVVSERVDARIAALIANDGWPLKPGVVGVLENLKAKGLRLCVATSTAKPRAQDRLVSAKIRHFFEHISGGDEVSNGKPAPDLFLLAAGRLKLAPSDCLVIEDSEYGAQAALAAGMGCVMVPDLKTPPDWIRPKLEGVFENLVSAASYILQR